MRILLSISIAFCFVLTAYSQTAKFDVMTYTAPVGWSVEKDADSIRFTKESGGNYCVISLTKAVESIGDSGKNFELLWQGMAKEGLNAMAAPQRGKTGDKDGWQAEVGVGSFEKNGLKGAVLLTTFTGGDRVVAILAITNSDAFEKDIAAFVDNAKLPKPALPAPAQTRAANAEPSAPAQPVNAARKSSFKFNISNFDDGWTAVEQEDWVRVTKGDITLLLHYPHPKDKEYISQQDARTRTFWDLLVAPRYSNLRNFELLNYDVSSEPGYFAAGNVTDNATGRSLYVVLFDKAKTGWIEIITPNKAAFTNAFGNIDFNGMLNDWGRFQKLLNYNKFAVAPSDLPGQWSTNFSSSVAYANVYSGSLVGVDTFSSAQSFDFGAGNSYRWQIHMARTGFGKSTHDGAKSSGTFSMPSNWQINFSNMEGKPKSLPVFFKCVKGARLLIIDGNAYGRIT